ncbi:uncharacterized protein LOC123442644 [Hordeum vulgare subsp. vulgare]|uniref:uncharacterized protein LOC123442644 n=1 Tax=Hordeum vulgare subsp. vulgare TaxID=112509 RepID=UPI001D1A41C7|nr:uncharacterized protein LOC123442644 [Hordeum vulgare subsp. vulgare]
MAPRSAPTPAWSSSSPTSSTGSRPRPPPASPAAAHVSSLLLLLPPHTVLPLWPSLPALSFLCPRRPSRHLPRTPHHSEPVCGFPHVVPLVKVRHPTLSRVVFDEMLQPGVRLDEYVYTAGIRAYCEAGSPTAPRGSWRGLGVKVSMVSYVLLYGFCNN